MNLGNPEPTSPLASWEPRMIEDLCLFLDGQPFCVDSDRDLYFTPGGDLGTDLHINMRALFEGDGSYTLQLDLAKEGEGDVRQPLAVRDLSIGVTQKDDVVSDALESRMLNQNTLEISPLYPDVKYRFFFASGVPARLMKPDNELSELKLPGFPDGE